MLSVAHPCKHAQAQTDAPRRQASPIQVDSDDIDGLEESDRPPEPAPKAEPRKEWDTTARIVYSNTPKGPVVKLLEQNSKLQAVIRQSFHILIKDMLFEDAYLVYKS